MTAKRVFLIVLDSLGAGEAPDAAAFGDLGANTLRGIHNTGLLRIPTLGRLGIGNIDGLSFLGPVPSPAAAFGKMRERSAGKDTTIGHWEIAGHVSPSPMPTFPHGFPQDLLNRFTELTEKGVLCNLPYSGTDVIRDYGEEHLRTGKLIVYTSADSVFQIAAHEDLVPPEELYEICRKARKLLTGDYAVGRVIARPFVGSNVSNFSRVSADRRDFSLEPPVPVLPDVLKAAGYDVLSVGKIIDIFAGRGFTKFYRTHGNDEGMAVTSELAKTDFHGLCFVNLVDFDMLYGHRNDARGYAGALNRFDAWLSGFLSAMRADDILLLTADHGCDPSDVSTDHTREYVPLLVAGPSVRPASLGVRNGFSDVAESVLGMLGAKGTFGASDFSGEVLA